MCTGDNDWIDSEYWYETGDFGYSDVLVDDISLGGYSYGDIKDYFNRIHPCNVEAPTGAFASDDWAQYWEIFMILRDIKLVIQNALI